MDWWNINTGGLLSNLTTLNVTRSQLEGQGKHTSHDLSNVQGSVERLQCPHFLDLQSGFSLINCHLTVIGQVEVGLVAHAFRVCKL